MANEERRDPAPVRSRSRKAVWPSESDSPVVEIPMESQLTSNARDFFRTAVADYDALHYGTRSLMSVRLNCMVQSLDRLHLAAGSRVLDAGCGPGHLLDAMNHRGWTCYGVDTSRAMLDLSSARIGIRPPRLATASVEKLPFANDTFDAVCTAGVFEYLTEDRHGLLELARVARSGAYVLFPITNFWSPIGYLDFLVESIKRRPTILRTFNRAWTRLSRSPIRARHFRVRKQQPGQTRRLLAEVGFEILEERYFYYLPFPHPFDRLFPELAERWGGRMDGMSQTALAPLGEGWLAVCRKVNSLSA